MRRYGQYCAMAKALDVVGDRWTLLIVRELLSRGGCRYTDLHDGLPGIASNLLADRLRDLEQAGVIWREAAPPPIATTLYRLTPRGIALRPVLAALGHWGGPLLAEAPDEDEFRSQWLILPIEELLRDRCPDGPPAAIEVRADDQPPIAIETRDGHVRARPGGLTAADLVLSGPHRVIMGVLAGRLDLTRAANAGLTVAGDRAVLARLQPAASPADARVTHEETVDKPRTAAGTDRA
jgi:DNA-binding HxlR family transcriptional regulator